MNANNRSKSSMPSAQSAAAFRPAALALAVAACFAGNGALGNPTNPAVVHGAASFSNPAANILNVQTMTPRTIINWGSFSISAGEITRFMQPSALAAVLNRVGAGASPSQILGTLSSNGRVFLINPNGITFGAGSQVDVAGLVASTLNLTNEDFLAGRMRFAETPGAGALTNAGIISTAPGGNVYLVAPDVRNSGLITSPQGEVILAAGSSVELVNPGTPNLRVEINAPDNAARNLGAIVADAGRVGIYAGLIEQKGEIRADAAVAGEGGRILLKATRSATLDAGSITSARGESGGAIEVNAGDTTLVAGTIDVRGTNGAGGTVHLLGDKVGVHGDARVDASGDTGGGTVLIGGEYQGRPGVTAVEGEAIRNATSTFVGAEVTVLASADTRGDGGRVIVWADDTTRVHGVIRARGGGQSGDGGFVETSGKLGLDVTRAPDVRAPRGQGGTWLLDPNDLDIVAGSGITNNTSQPFFAPLADSSSIGVDLINLQLDFGSNVVLTTTSAGTGAGSQAGNITVLAPIAKTVTGVGTTSLTMQAHNNVVIGPGGSITSTGDALHVTLTANAFGGGTGGVTVGGAITTNGGTVNISGNGLTAINAPIDTRVSGSSFGGSVFLTSDANLVNVSATIDSGSFFSADGATGVNINTAVTSGGGMSLDSFGGQVTVAAPLTVGSFFSASGSTGVNINAAVTSGSSISLDSSSGPINVNAAMTGGFFDVFAGGAGSVFTLTAPVSVAGADLVADDMNIAAAINAGGGSIFVQPATFNRPMNLGTNVAGSLSLTQAELDNLMTGGSKNFGGSTSGIVTVSTPVTIGTSSVSIDANTAFTVSPGASLSTAVPLDINAPTITLDGPVSAQHVTLTANSINVNAPVTSTTDINVFTRSFFRPINLGVGSDSPASLDFTAAELNNLVTGATNPLRIGSTSSGALTIQGAIAPTGTSTLVLSSGSAVSQAAGATITVPNLALDVFGNVNLPEANVVGTLAADLCCSGNTFLFANAPATPLAIGSVAGINGVSNFSSNSTGTIVADNLTVGASVFFDTLTVRPTGTSVVLDLGGADAAGRLGISAADFSNLFADTLTLKADLADISAPVASSSTTLVLAPMTAGRALHVTSGPKNPANLELTPAEIGNVSANTMVLGDSGTGPVAVNTALAVPSGIATFGLRSGDTANGIIVNSTLNANTDTLTLTADAMTLNAGVTGSGFGGVKLATNTAGRPIDLGTKTAGTLGLNPAELGLITASSGPLVVGDLTSGDLTVSQPLTFTTIGDLHLTTGGTLVIGSALTNTSLGAFRLTANAMNIGAAVTGNGDINIMTAGPSNPIALGTKPGGTTLGLVAAELDLLVPGTGTLRIGDNISSKSFNIQLTAPIAPANATTLSLQTENGSVNQVGGAITVTNLAVLANSGITLSGNNDIGTVALETNFGTLSFVHNGASPLTIGTVDSVTGVRNNFGGNAAINANELNIASFISATNVNITPQTSLQPMSLGTKPGGTLGLTEVELNSIFATSLTLGIGNPGTTTVTAPVNITSFSNLTMTTQTFSAINVNNALTVPGNLTLSTGTLNVMAPLSAGSFGTLTAIADNMTFGAAVSASTMNLRPVNPLTVINLGGPDIVSTTNTLGLDAVDIGNLATSTLTIGGSTVPSITVSAATNFGSTPTTTLITSGGGTGTINVDAALSTAGNLTLSTDNLVISGPGSVAGANVSLGTITSGRTIDLGAAGSGTFLGLDAAALNSMTATGTLTISANGSGTSGTILVSNPVGYTGAPNLTLNAGTLNTVGTLGASGVLTLRANAMDITNTVSAVEISVAPRSSSVMSLGPTGSGLLLSQAEINQFSTPGVLRLGNTSTTSTMSITGPISYAPATPLHLSASSGFNQTAGSTLTVPNLRLQGGSVTLTEANNVGTLAGTGGTFQFTNNGLLNIGSVDGINGISGGTTTLKGDTIAISQPVSGSSVTLAPRVGGSPIDVGSKPGGVFGVTDAEIDMVSATTLNIGQSTGTSPSGSITVSAPVNRPSGNFNLAAQPGSTINVNANFTSPNASVSMNAGTGGAVNVGAAVSAFNSVTLTAGTINVNAPVSSSNSNVTLSGGAGGTVNVGATVTAFSSINVTADNVNLAAPLVTTGSTVTIAPGTAGVPVNVGTETAGALSLSTAELALIDTDILTLGSTSAGPLTVTAPFSSATLDELRLRSGGAITQSPGATLTLTDPAGGSLQLTSSGGSVTMTEANTVAGFLSGSASGGNFDFNNSLPMKLQNISASASGKVRINGAASGFVPAPFIEGEPEINILAPANAAFERSSEANEVGEAVESESPVSEQQKKDKEDENKKPQMCR